MKKFFSFLLASLLVIICEAQEQTMRVSVIASNDNSYMLNAQFNILSPNGTTIYVGSHPEGEGNSVVTRPLFVNSNNETLLCFNYSHSCYCMNPNHTLFITNSAGWETVVSVGSQYYFNQMVPLDPSGYTVITIEFR